MRCPSCDHRYSAARGQPSPGGSSAPGVFLVVAVLTTSAGAVALGRGATAWAAVAALTTAFVCLQLFVAWSDCRKTGGRCPGCGGKNPVRPWSM